MWVPARTLCILPLDRIATQAAPSIANQNRGSSSSVQQSGGTGMTPGDIRSLTDQVIQELRSRQTDDSQRGSIR
jgi:membrane protease subunit HflK